MSARELVVLLDEEGRATGTADKAGVHGPDTPLHLAFSCYVLDADRRLLLTRRALHKKTWPGVWTNTVCGHPGPGEPIHDAVRRRARGELGLELDTLTLVLPAYRYRFAMHDGTVENEMCPVFVATTHAEARPDPDEVDDVAWVDWADLRAQVLAGARDVSPWCADQLRQLPAEPWSAPDADPGLLPAAARPRA
jgi:isopentenyl-diphosphate delta-isomerase